MARSGWRVEGSHSTRRCSAGRVLDAFLLEIHYSGEKRVRCTAEAFVNISGSKWFQQPVGALSKRGGVAPQACEAVVHSKKKPLPNQNSAKRHDAM